MQRTYPVLSGVCPVLSTGLRNQAALDGRASGLYRLRQGISMRNGLYSIHVFMLNGVKGRDSGVIILRDGKFLGGGPYFWWTGSYTFTENGTWKGELTTNQHTRFADPSVRPVFGGHEVTTGFSGTFTDYGAEAFATSLVGTKSVSSRATMKWLAEE